MTDKKLRIQALSIQVALVWDDGEELTPGPDLAPVTVSLSQARQMVDGLPAEVEKLTAQLDAADECKHQYDSNGSDTAVCRHCGDVISSVGHSKAGSTL